jgi:hypothetical protein
MNIKNYLKKELSDLQIKKIRKTINFFKSIGHGNDLTKLAKIYKTDKWGDHFYTPHYTTHFKKFKYKKIILLEIGVGGNENPRLGGGSLRMWKKYFPKGKIFSIDIYDKSFHEEKRISIYKGSQIDKPFLMNLVAKTSKPDIIIDDGSHFNKHVIETFGVLFPMLKEGGIYVIEDVQSSYWPYFGGDNHDLNNPNTTMNFFKKLTDSLNYKEFIKPDYQPTYFDENIISIHFYHNLIFIYKGRNDENSNVIKHC